MNKIFFLLFIISITFLFCDVNVKGYYKSNGTYVEPHHRSDPNDTKNDNWSTRGNINPYTEEEGDKTYYNYNNYGREQKSNNYSYDDYERDDGDTKYTHSIISHKENKEPFWAYIETVINSVSNR